VNEKTLRVALVGDVHLCKPLAMLGQPEAAELLRHWTGTADVAIANLEMALTIRGAPADKLVNLRGDPRLAQDLANCGFSAVTLANNHTMDYGPAGLQDTLASLQSVGLSHVGTGRDWDEATRPLRLDLPGNRRFHVVNFACTLPAGAAAGPCRPGVAPLRVTQRHWVDPLFALEQPGTSPWVETQVLPQDERAACEAVSRAREEGGWVLAIIHWGVPPYWHAPFQGDLATYQRPLARRLVEAGAHAVVGHHPHVLHGVEIVEGSPVFYSLGNFVWHPVQSVTRPPREDLPSEPGYRLHWRQALSSSAADPRKRESVVLHLSWTGRSWQAGLLPIWLDETGEPRPASSRKAEEILTRLQEMSRKLGCSLELAENEATVAGEIMDELTDPI
jgi:poly-gamma-glutamate synthesis protein (capsule biosynthesis protein)